jgi:hypothetical protein
LESQIGKNVEVYVDDVVVQTTAEDDLIVDLAETFTNLQYYCWKLNPEKCVFGVPSSKLLGFMVIHQGIEANPTKVDTIRRMNRPTGKKDVMKLTGMMATLGHFISKLGEKGLPFKDRKGEPEGGSEWEPIKVLLEGDRDSNKMNTASNTRLRLNYPSRSRPCSHWSATDPRNQQTTF